ncbi:MAG: signal peptide peptidase SppA [Hyphomicrobiales bacterium]|nr:signal peptide peptidase SppA [Hyphomicrobiales bacterium]
MSQSDYLVERRALTRKLSFWRIAAIAAVIGAVLALGLRWSGFRGAPLTPHIARISIDGMILGDKKTLDLVKQVAKSNAAGVILSIDSPGGTVTGSEKLYDELRRLAEKKPTVALANNIAASGAYVAALAADHIVSYDNSIVGSIGVLMNIPNVSKLLDTIGVKMEEIKSSPLKAAPDGLVPTSEEARKAADALIRDSFAWFRDLVKQRRKMSEDEIAAVADGRVFTGRQGVPLKLVDELGGERAAIAWLEQQKGVAKGMPVRDWKPKSSIDALGIFGRAAGLAQFLGLPEVAAALQRGEARTGPVALDGILAIWQGSTLK